MLNVLVVNALRHFYIPLLILIDAPKQVIDMAALVGNLLKILITYGFLPIFLVKKILDIFMLLLMKVMWFIKDMENMN